MIYFDYASTTPVNPEVIQTYNRLLNDYYVNSESLYPKGMEISRLMEKSRSDIAGFLKVQPSEIIFTSGGSEANNLAIKGVGLHNLDKGKHIIASSIEHSSVINSLKWLEKYFGFEIDYLPVNSDGVVNPSDVKRLIRDDTILVTVMYINNETGAIQPIDDIKKIVRKYHNCYFHCDCVQALGKIELDLTGIDLASFSAHKINGLKGSGFLMKKQHVQIDEVISGGQQENHLRGGTANSPANIVLSKTMRLAFEKFRGNYSEVCKLHDYLYSQLESLDKVVLNSPRNGSPFVINFSCLTITSQVMMNALVEKGFEVSAQSTCDSNDAISRVIAQMYNDVERLKGTIRVSFGYDSKFEDVKSLLESIKEIIKVYG